MAFTNSTCKEAGRWAGTCHHGEITVHKGERFPECPECRRGIDWHLVPHSVTKGRDPRHAGDDWAQEGWWPGKDDGAATNP